jgi:hypothetical protein
LGQGSETAISQIEPKYGQQNRGSGYTDNGNTSFNPCLIGGDNVVHGLQKRESTSIGQHSQNDIVIYGPGITTYHAILTSENETMYIEANGMAVVYVNGGAVVGRRRRLRNNDIIQLGNTLEFVYLQDGPVLQNTQQAQPEENIIPVPIFDTSPATRSSSRESALQFRSSAAPNSDLFGRVSQIEGPHSQKPVQTAGKVMGDMAIFLASLWKPAFLLLGRNKQPDQVRLIRVRTPDGTDRLVLMRGGYKSGVIQMGDEVSFYGEWQDGTLVMRSAINHSLSARVTLTK